MTAAMYRSGTPSFAVPPTQNSAPVLEFNCMYTHDLRRKQKRWQDGFVRFHTFNKRVMVYDIPRNLIGDTHWKAGTVLQDGDEVLLEREGVTVQVAENIGRTETDLTELRNSKKNKSSEAGSSPLRAAPASTAIVLNGNAPRSTTQLKHRSLNALLATPKGPIGKATLPTKSPFEERYTEVENGEWEVGRLAKRRRIDQPSGWNVTWTTTTVRPTSKMDLPRWARSPHNGKQNKITPLETGQQTLGTKEIIDLSVDNEDEQAKFLNGFSSDVLVAPSSPPKNQHPAKRLATVRSSSPAFQRQRTPEHVARQVSSERTSRSKAQAVSGRLPRPKSPDFNVYEDESQQPPAPMTESRGQSNRRNSHQSMDPKRPRSKPVPSTKPPDSKLGKTLRMSASGQKKKTLLCQDQVSKPSRVHSANTENAIDALLNVTSQDAIPDQEEQRNQRQQLQERLTKISRKSAPTRDEIHDNADVSDMMMSPPRQLSREIEAPAIPSERQLRRVVPGSHDLATSRPKRIPGAPIRITKPPPKKAPSPAPLRESSNGANHFGVALAPPLPKQRAMQRVQRSASLNTTSNKTSAFHVPKAPQMKSVVAEKAADAWSREAFDLFTWRPPEWDEENWCLKSGNAVAGAGE